MVYKNESEHQLESLQSENKTLQDMISQLKTDMKLKVRSLVHHQGFSWWCFPASLTNNILPFFDRNLRQLLVSKSWSQRLNPSWEGRTERSKVCSQSLRWIHKYWTTIHQLVWPQLTDSVLSILSVNHHSVHPAMDGISHSQYMHFIVCNLSLFFRLWVRSPA